MVEYSEEIYDGQLSPLDPEYSQILNQINFSDLGTSQDARAADQVKETTKHLNTGITTFEVAAHSPEVFESMPNEQLTEIRRLAEITGATPTIHAPMVDPTGITQHGWNELNQKAAEAQLWEAIRRSHELAPKGNINVTLHASSVGLPFPELKVKEGKEEKIKSIILIDSQGGELKQITEREKYFPEKGGKIGEPIPFEPKEEIKKLNKEAWDNTLQNVAYNLSMAGGRWDSYGLSTADKKAKELVEKFPEIKKEHPELEFPEERTSHKGVYLRRSYNQLKELFNLAWKYADNDDRKKLSEFSEKVSPYAQKFEQATKDPKEIEKFSKILEDGFDIFDNIKNPQIFVPLSNFAREKSAETISNLALKSFDTFKNTAPIISVENHPAGQSLLTTGEDLKEVIEKARHNFEKKAILSKEKGGFGLSKSEAKKQAEKLIGATWDLGHINMLRKYGYDKEDIIKETEKIAKYVKKVHLSDNFGFEHTELPMGMGNVPTKEILEKLKKEGYKGKNIIEALSWWQHFSEQGRIHALIPTLRGTNVPVYTAAPSPYWNQILDASGMYQALPMAYLPEKNFQTYGTTFHSLPQELGGQIPGTQSRFSGTPNA